MINTVYVHNLEEIKQLSEEENYQVQYKFCNSKDDVKFEDSVQEQNQQVQEDDQNQTKFRLRAENLIYLYGLCFSLYKQINKKKYMEIQSGYLSFSQDERQKAVQFMNRAVCKPLENIKNDYQAEILINFLRNQLRFFQVKFILKFQNDLDITSQMKKPTQSLYILVFFSKQQIQVIVDLFITKKLPIQDALTKKKLQFLNLLDREDKTSSNNTSRLDLNQNVFGFGEEKKVYFRYFEGVDEGKQEMFESFMSSSISQIIVPQSQLSTVNKGQKRNQPRKVQFLLIYGLEKGVQRCLLKITSQLQNVKQKIFKPGDKLFNNFIFASMRLIAQGYNKIQIFQVSKDFVQILYHSSIQSIFNQEIMGYDNYKRIKVKQLRYVFKESKLADKKFNIADLVFYQDNHEGQIVIGKKEIIESLEQEEKMLRQKRVKSMQIIDNRIQKYQNTPNKNNKNDQQRQIKTQKVKSKPQWKIQQAMIYQTQQKQQVMKPEQGIQISQFNLNKQFKKPIIQFQNNIQISQNNYRQLLQICQHYKQRQNMTFKIDVGEYIRITNRAQKQRIIYLIFQTYSELIQLQSIIQQPIPLAELSKLIHQFNSEEFVKTKVLEQEGERLIVRLYYCREEVWANRDTYFRSIMTEIKENREAVFRAVVCSVKIMKEILNAYVMDFNIIFAVNQKVPCIQCDQIFDKQTMSYRIKVSKVQNQYTYFLKSGINNSDFKTEQNLKKQIQILKSILYQNLHQYQIGQYILSEVDQYNIAYMVAQNLNSMFFTLAKNTTEEFVYLVYFQKLVKVLRNKNGHFQRLLDVTMGKDINRNNQTILKPIIQRAFLTGQRFLSISLPFDHIKSVKLTNIKTLGPNRNLISYYQRKIIESPRYKLTLLPSYTVQQFRHKFAKSYTLRFNDEQIKHLVKSINLGHGTIKKWKEKPYYCLKTQYYFCERLLEDFLEEYRKGKQLKQEQEKGFNEKEKNEKEKNEKEKNDKQKQMRSNKKIYKFKE